MSTLITLMSALLGGGVMSFVQFLIARHDRQRKEEIDPERFEELIKLNLAVSQDRLVYLGESYIENGDISIRDWSIYDEMFKHYAELGGNHYAQEIHEEVKKLKRIS